MEGIPDFDPLGLDTPPEDLGALQRLVRLASMFGFCSVVEVGSWVGRTALAMLKTEGVHARIYCVDTFQGTKNDKTGVIAEVVQRNRGQDEVFRTFCHNIGNHLHTNITPCVGPSQLWAEVWRGEVDMVFIDADHSAAAVKADIQAWMRHVRPGGIICGHDYNVDGFPGVKQAVDELLGSKVNVDHTVWWAVNG